MAGSNFKGGPGGRLKREEEKNTLYVNNPNDHRLKAYQDSLNVYNIAEKNWESAKKFGKLNSGGEVYIPTRMVNAIPGAISIKTKFQPFAYRSTVDENRNFNRDFPIYKKPERPVIFVERKKTEPIEPLTIRQSTPAKFAPNEIIAPIVRPVKQLNQEPSQGIGSILRYPSQELMGKIKRRLTGEPSMPYWVDKDGVKRYPHLGENSPQDVKMMDLLRKE